MHLLSICDKFLLSSTKFMIHRGDTTQCSQLDKSPTRLRTEYKDGIRLNDGILERGYNLLLFIMMRTVDLEADK